MANNVKVKVCGLTNLADAQVAVNCGADLIGFIFAASPRQVISDQVQEIRANLEGQFSTVGVFANQELKEVNKITQECKLDYLQLHGSESPAYCKQLEQPIIKAFSIKDEASLEELEQYDVDKYLLDTYHPDKLGGTGETFNWELAKEAKEYGSIFLAGGLDESNVKQAIKQVNPAGVDVSSGVEFRAGKKNHKQVKLFIEAAKSSN